MNCDTKSANGRTKRTNYDTKSADGHTKCSNCDTKSADVRTKRGDCCTKSANGHTSGLIAAQKMIKPKTSAPPVKNRRNAC